MKIQTNVNLLTTPIQKINGEFACPSIFPELCLMTPLTRC